jgi:hypothetical protein
MINYYLVNPTKGFSLGIEYMNGRKYGDNINFIIVGLLFFEIVISY